MLYITTEAEKLQKFQENMEINDSNISKIAGIIISVVSVFPDTLKTHFSFAKSLITHSENADIVYLFETLIEETKNNAVAKEFLLSDNFIENILSRMKNTEKTSEFLGLAKIMISLVSSGIDYLQIDTEDLVTVILKAIELDVEIRKIGFVLSRKSIDIIACNEDLLYLIIDKAINSIEYIDNRIYEFQVESTELLNDVFRCRSISERIESVRIISAIRNVLKKYNGNTFILCSIFRLMKYLLLIGYSNNCILGSFVIDFIKNYKSIESDRILYSFCNDFLCDVREYLICHDLEGFFDDDELTTELLKITTSYNECIKTSDEVNEYL